MGIDSMNRDVGNWTRAEKSIVVRRSATEKKIRLDNFHQPMQIRSRIDPNSINLTPKTVYISNLYKLRIKTKGMILEWYERTECIRAAIVGAHFIQPPSEETPSSRKAISRASIAARALTVVRCCCCCQRVQYENRARVTNCVITSLGLVVHSARSFYFEAHFSPRAYSRAYAFITLYVRAL